MQDALAALHGQDVVALDGLDAIAGQREDEVALFDFHNRARTAGTAVMYTARETPAELGLGLPDLRSRLSQCVQVILPALDDGGRREVLRERAQRRGLVLEEAAIDWLLTRTDRDLGRLVALLDQLDRASLAAQRRITVPFLRSVLETRS
jgi:DnaA family protein